MSSTEQDALLVARVFDKARHIISHPSRPTVHRLESFSQRPHAELALEPTLEESPVLSLADDLLVDTVEEKKLSCVAILDNSFSMSGEKHLLASVAAAVLLLQVPSELCGLVLFSSQANSVKSLWKQATLDKILRDFLRHRPSGFTNIAAGLKEGIAQYRGRKTRKIALLATDGRFTEGEDPLPFASAYDFLLVLHLHGPGSHLEMSQQLAQSGHGLCLEVKNFSELPRRIYDAVKFLGRY